MARPLKEGMDYFPHDTDASNDEKIEALRALYGNDGYAFYFILLERIYRTRDAELDISNPAVLAALIKKVGVTQEKFEAMLATAFEIDCLSRDDYEDRKVLTSKGIKRRANEIQKMRSRWRKQRKANDGDSPEDNQEVILVDNSEDNPGDNPGENSEETGESKVKKSKVKYSTTPLPPPTKEGGQVVAVVEKGSGEETIGEVARFVANSFIPGAGPLQVERICSWVNEGMESDAVIYAMEIALLADVRRVDYVEAILRRWHSAGIRTRAQAEAEEVEYRARAESRKKSRGKYDNEDKPGGVVYADLTKKLAELDT